jgi:hypothetical protein
MNNLNFRIKETGKNIRNVPSELLAHYIFNLSLKPFKPSPICCKGNISVS